MKESEAWRILAEEHDAGRIREEYLCIALDRFGRGSVRGIPALIRHRMIERIEDAVGGDGAAYDDYEYNEPDVRPSRVLACLMFSEQAKDEERGR